MPSKQQDAPTLSICIPAYNRPKWLRRAILSVLETPTDRQSQIEIVVSDDSTRTNCRELIRKLMKNWHGSWQYQANVPNLGMAANWNRCIQIATGHYVLLLHDDDYLETNAAADILRSLQQNTDITAFLFGVNIVTSEQKIYKRQVASIQQYSDSEASLQCVLTDSSFIRFPGMVIKRTAFDKVGDFNTTIGGVADIDMWVRICHEYGLLQIPLTIANYTVHANALTMGMFTAPTVVMIETMFKKVQSQQWLAEKVLQTCKANYFSQFILAGTVRYIKARNFRRAQEVFNLFSQTSIQHNQAATKWKMIKACLRTFLILAEAFTFVPQSNEV